METGGGLQLALLSSVFDGRNYDTIGVDLSFGPWFIGCGWLMFLVQIFPLVRPKLRALPGLRFFHQKLLALRGLQLFHHLPGPSMWLANIQIYIGAASDVLVCYVSLLRINFSYLGLAIIPLIAIIFICVMMHNHLSAYLTNNGKKGTTERKKKGRKTTVRFKKDKSVTFEYIVALLAPHFILYASGMVGDPDHDGNNYDISCFFLFLTCMLQDLKIMTDKLPAGISCGISPPSEFLYKASLVLLLLTPHMVVVNAFGRKVVIILLWEVVPLLLWFSLHLDRRTPITSVQKMKDTEHFLWAVVVAVCGCTMAVLTAELLFYWAGWSCLASAVMTHIIVLVLYLWPGKKARIATLSLEEVLDLLTFWGKFLLKVAAGLFALRVVTLLKSTFGA